MLGASKLSTVRRSVPTILATLTALTALASAACSSDAGPPIAPAPGGSTSLYSQPGADAGISPSLPPLGGSDAGVIDFDAGLTPTYDAAVTPPPPANDAGPIPCPSGGEIEVEPNESTPNVLNNIRCGVVTPGDTDVLSVVVSGTVNFNWSGAVNVTATQPTVGGPYHLTITSQTPTVNTFWVLQIVP